MSPGLVFGGAILVLNFEAFPEVGNFLKSNLVSNFGYVILPLQKKFCSLLQPKLFYEVIDGYVKNRIEFPVELGSADPYLPGEDLRIEILIIEVLVHNL